MDAAATILSVTSRTLNGGKAIYDVAANVEANGLVTALTMQTFEQSIAQQAAAFQGQRCSVRYESQQKGQYTNTYLNAIAPEGQLPVEIPTTGGRGGRPGGGGGFKRSPEETASIVKQNVLGTAFEAVSTLYTGLGPELFEEMKATALSLAAELFDIAKPKAPGDPQTVQPVAVVAAPAVAVVPATPAAVAAVVPGIQVGTAAVSTADGAKAIAWD